MIRLLAAAALSFGVTAALVPLLGWLARRRSWLVAHPADDRWHQRHVVKVGGVGMLAGLVSLLFFAPAEPLGRLLLLAVLMFVAGFVDDVHPIRPWMKLGAQLAATLAFLLLGPLPHISGVDWIDAVLSVAWIVFFTNAVNLLDNVDGLAAGVIAIAGSFAMALVAGTSADASLVTGLASLVGACVAFLLYNRPPASVFMGDSGSHLLGSFIGGATLLAVSAGARPVAHLSVLALLLVVPLADTLLVIVTRAAARVSPFTGGRDHISHRLVAIGMSEGGAVVALCVYAIGGGLAALALLHLNPVLAWSAASVFAAGTVAAAFNVGRVPIERRLPPTASQTPDTSAPGRSEGTIAGSSPASAARANPVL